MIEDDPFFGRLSSKALEDAGHLVTWSKDGEDGLTELENEVPDLVTLDIILPKMNGLEILAKIRENLHLGYKNVSAEVEEFKAGDNIKWLKIKNFEYESIN